MDHECASEEYSNGVKQGDRGADRWTIFHFFFFFPGGVLWGLEALHNVAPFHLLPGLLVTVCFCFCFSHFFCTFKMNKCCGNRIGLAVSFAVLFFWLGWLDIFVHS